MSKFLIFFFFFELSIFAQMNSEFRMQLASGDPEALARVSNSTSPTELFILLNLASLNKLGEHSGKIKSLVIENIKKNKEYVTILGDQIDQNSNDKKVSRSRKDAFYLLGNIATPEAVAEIARFLFDDRNPEAHIPPSSGLYHQPNSTYAADALSIALGDKINAKRKPGFNGQAEVKAWQDWWKSPEAQKYKKSTTQDVPVSQEVEE